METNLNEVKINGVKYVPKDTVSQKADSMDGMPYCIVRTYSAGVFAGYVASRNGQEVVIKKARRLWYWSGAASLSQLAVDGVSNPKDCKFPSEVESITVTQAVEILDVTNKAKESIANVQVWKA